MTRTVPSIDPADLVSAPEAATALAVHLTTITRMVRAGTLRPLRYSPYIFHRVDVERVAAERKADQ